LIIHYLAALALTTIPSKKVKNRGKNEQKVNIQSIGLGLFGKAFPFSSLFIGIAFR